MEIEIVPEPPAEERDAIVAALAGEAERPADDPYRSRWRRAELAGEED